MVLEWLKKILQPETKTKTGSALENSSLHTMGPEELLDDDSASETISSDESEEEYLETPAQKKTINNREEDEESNRSPTKEHALKVMEAALFMGGKGLSIEELGKISNVPLLKIREYLPELVDAFNARDSALELVEDAGGYRMRVRSPYDEKVSHLAGVGELNPAEMKTLAFIAYKQPLLQSHLVQVRSNTAYEHLQKLVETGFVSREPRGRTYVLRTTKKFAEYFGTNALKLRPYTAEMKKNSSDIPAVDQSQSEELL
jgi:segregation and condensation protein B